MSDLRCPRCRVDLAPESHGGARFERCPNCRGLALNVAVLRQFAPEDRVRDLWINLTCGREGAPCPSCGRAALDTPVACGARTVEVGVCRGCQLLWFDADELAAFSPTCSGPTPRAHALSPASAEALVRANYEADRLGAQAIDEARAFDALVAGLFGAV